MRSSSVEVGAIAVVAVVIDDADRVGRQPLGDLARDGRLARAGAAGDADEERCHARNHSAGARQLRDRSAGDGRRAGRRADALAAVEAERVGDGGRQVEDAAPVAGLALAGSSRPTRRRAGWRRTDRGRAPRTARSWLVRGFSSMTTEPQGRVRCAQTSWPGCDVLVGARQVRAGQLVAGIAEAGGQPAVAGRACVSAEERQQEQRGRRRAAAS